MKPTPSQRICIEETFGMPSAVAAGAGSGKTATLTARIVYALRHPELSGVADIGQILAITYTNKAAAEMRSRFKEALVQAGLLEQAAKVDGAWVSTIHGMCSRILRENAYALGVDPQFKVLPDDLGDAMRVQAFEDALHALGGADSAYVHDVTALFDEYRARDVQAMVLSIIGQGAGELTAPEMRNKPVDCLMRLFSYAQQLASACRDGSGYALKFYENALPALAAVLGVAPSDAVLSAVPDCARIAQLAALSAAELLALADLFPKMDKRTKVPDDVVPDGSSWDARTSLFAATRELCLALGGRHLPVLIELANGTQARFAAAKRAGGYLDNDDMLEMVAAALKDPANTGLRACYTDRFKLVMVDEFQDTNAMQVELINLMAGGSAEKPSNRLCVVGDAQQSIYRFRNADLAVFQDHVARVRAAEKAGAAKLVQLGENFRSHAQILAFAKGVFEPVFGKDSFLDLLHARNEELAARKKPFFGIGGMESDEVPEGRMLAEIPHRINVNLFDLGGNASMAAYAAEAIARDFETLIDRGHKPGNMAILLGSMTHAGDYAAALQARNIPCAITGGSVFKGSKEVKLLTSLCYVLVNPFDTERLVDVLSGDLFALEPDDFMQLVPSLPETWADDPASLADVLAECAGNRATEQDMRDCDYSPRLANALAVLVSAARMVGTAPLSDVAEYVLVNSGWLERLGKDATVSCGNAFKGLRMLRALEQETGCDALALARLFDARVATLKEAPGVLSAEGSNFVRIMTIHASKGLQFPIVAVSEAEFAYMDRDALKDVSVGGKTYIALDPPLPGEGLKSSGIVKSCKAEFANALAEACEAKDMLHLLEHPQDMAEYCAALKSLDRQGAAEEHQRKLYVAYTRAEDCLIVCLKKPSASSDPTGSAVANAIIGLLGGYEGWNGLAGEGGYERTLSHVSTRYAGHPEHDIDWTARVQVFGKEFDPSMLPASDKASGEAASVREVRAFVVPTKLLPFSTADVPLRFQWTEGIVSASALKHEADEDENAGYGQAPMAASPLAADADDDGGESDGLLGADEGAEATERGTAFHALGEWAATAWQPGCALAMPPDSRIAAMARMYGLNAIQAEHLHDQLRNWLASDAAACAADHAHMVPEAPFYVKVADRASAGKNPLILQGFIDLLAYDEMGSGSAYVVDYKTGYYLQSDEARRTAYGIQAKCYAYALLLQGFADVQLDFVFVDQGGSATHFPAPDEPPYTLEGLRADILAALR